MTARSMSLWTGLRRIFAAAPRRRRAQALGVSALMLVGAGAELLTLGALLPFLALMADPQAALRYPLLQDVLLFFGLDTPRKAITGIAALFCVIAVLAAMIRILLAWASQKLVFRLGYDLGVSLYERILYQSYSFHVMHDSSSTVASVNKIQQVLNQTMMPVLQGVTAATIAIFILGGLMVIDAPVALASAGGFGLVYLSVSYATRKRLRANSEVISRANTARVKTVQEGLGGIRDVLVDQSQPAFVGKFARIDNQLRVAQATNAMITAAPRFVIEGMGMVMIAILALILNSRPGGLTTALPVLGAMALGAQRLLPLLQQIYNGWTSIAGNRGTLFDVLAFLDLPLPADLAARKTFKPLPFERSLALQDVTFRYTPNGPPVLKHVTLDIPKGARIGFIGKTGSGKSTIMDLVMGLLEPTGGGIAIDGVRLTPDRVPNWQMQIAHVSQNIFLSDATILENIAFGMPLNKIDEVRARDAAHRAELDTFIVEQAEGYRTVVGERGIRLSGGQRQRIGIARALYKKSTVLILDEATSALDSATEQLVMESIERLGSELTILMIAHRISTLRSCDVIYRLDRGVIAGQGSYAEMAGDAGLVSIPLAAGVSQ